MLPEASREAGDALEPGRVGGRRLRPDDPAWLDRLRRLFGGLRDCPDLVILYLAETERAVTYLDRHDPIAVLLDGASVTAAEVAAFGRRLPASTLVLHTLPPDRG